MSRPDPRQALSRLEPRLLELCREISRQGGRPLVVGGFVRDFMRGEASKDVDIEVYSMSLDTLRECLVAFGPVIDVGRSFGVLRVRGLDVDFSLPRRDSYIGRGHRGIRADLDPALSLEEATRRRDLTINALTLDPLTGEVHDPCGGLDDLRRGRLRAVDPGSFGEDPLRALRVMQFAARFEMEVDPELARLCAQQDLAELSRERIYGEWSKWARLAKAPSRGLNFLKDTGLLAFFPELQALVDVPQDPQWHPEGDVWTHTVLVTDQAARLRRGELRFDLALLFGALCHDFGKPSTTEDDGEHIRSRSHDTAGVPLVATFLGRMRAPLWLVEAVQVLTANHLVPSHFHKGNPGDRAYRRLARRLARADVTLELLEAVARADHLGRTTADAVAGHFDAGDAFLARASQLDVQSSAPPDVVLGRHLLEHGLQPGPHIGELLGRCRRIQDETGWTDVERILERALEHDPGNS